MFVNILVGMKKKWDVVFSAPEQQACGEQAVRFLHCKKHVGRSLVENPVQIGIMVEYGVVGEADTFHTSPKGFVTVRDICLLARKGLSPVCRDEECDIAGRAVQQIERFPIFRKESAVPDNEKPWACVVHPVADAGHVFGR
jgi:hypothetical protein